MSRAVMQQAYTLSEENVNDLLGWLRAGQINRAVIALEHLNPAELAQPVQPDNTSKPYEELRSIIDGGSESFTHKDAVQYLKDNLAPLKWTPEDMAYRPGGLPQPDHPEQMARLGWQYVECPACGSEGARAFPKPEEQQSCDKQEPVVLPEGKRLILVDGTFDELVYWLDRCEDKGHLENCYDLVEPWANFKYENYASPPQRQPLTHEQITKAFNEAMAKRPKDASNAETNRLFVQSIEAKLKEKNT